ncbi:MAG TPA: cation-transporting P-type ATPase, partial [Burkholderiaceae bacterium]|nr:cation-transporting P-type ATPase [Burkholderiaceae bacterium]
MDASTRHAHGPAHAHAHGRDQSHGHAHPHTHDHGHAHDACCAAPPDAAGPPPDARGVRLRIATMDCAAEEAEIRAALGGLAGIRSL